MRWSTREEYVAALLRAAERSKQTDRATRLLRNVPRFPTGDPLKRVLTRLQEGKQSLILGTWHDCVQDCNCQMVLQPHGEGYIETL